MLPRKLFHSTPALQRLLLSMFALVVAASARPVAADNATKPIKATYRPPAEMLRPGPDALAKALSKNEYVFTAPPRETVARGEETYGPIAEYLSKVLGKEIVYKHPDNWLSYQDGMQKGEYDLVFDGPHFVSWRVARRQHEPLVKIPGDFIFVFLARKDNHKVTQLKHLAGRQVCGHAPPNQGTLRLYNQFHNPSRQPQLVPVKGWRNIYKAVIAKKCDGGIVPLKIYKKVDPRGQRAKVLFVTQPAPGQAFTAGPSFTAEDKAKITEALLSPAGQEATKMLRKRFPAKRLVRAIKTEYAGVNILLKDTWGFDS